MEGLDARALQERDRSLFFQPEVSLQLEQEGVGGDATVSSKTRGFLQKEPSGRRWETFRGFSSFFLSATAHGHGEQKNGRHHTDNADGESDQDCLHVPPFFNGLLSLGAREVPAPGWVTTLVENLFFDDSFS